MAAKKPRQPAPPRAPAAPRPDRPQSIGEAAKSLEEILNVSRDHHERREQTRSPQRQTEPTPRSSPAPTNTPAADRRPADPMNEQAEVLVRAMVSAAKSDGQISASEQQQIIDQLGGVSQQEVDFLRQEFSRELDVRDFAWSVPIGMEEQVYQVSLIAIDLDEMKEAQYLADLARGLRLPPERCNAIHRRLGAPVIFQE
jgi:uncharacterized membrane protein YebE (DUF533 family)